MDRIGRMAAGAITGLVLLACASPSTSSNSSDRMQQTPTVQPTPISTEVNETPASSIAEWKQELVNLDPEEVCQTLVKGKFEALRALLSLPK